MTHVTHMKSNDGKHANWCLVLRMGVVLMAAIVFAVMLLPAEAHASYRVKSPDIPTEGVSAIELDGEASVSCESYGCVWLMFTPSKTGWYEFTSKGSVDSYGALYKMHPADNTKLLLIRTDDDGAGKSQFSLKCELEAGLQYYIACSCFGSNAGSYTVYAKPFDIYDIDNMELHGGKTSFLSGSPADVKALGIRAANLEESIAIGKGMEIVGYSVWDSESEAYVALTGTTAPSTAGKYRLLLQGVAPYHGTAYFDFNIEDEVSLNEFNCSARKTQFWNDKAITIADLGDIFVYPQGGIDYALDSSCYVFDGWQDNNRNALIDANGNPMNPSAAGYYYAVFSGKNGYTGTISLPVDIIDAHNLNSFLTVHDNSYVGDGAPFPWTYIEPVIVLHTGSAVTLDDCDFELKRPVDFYYFSNKSGLLQPSDIEWAETLKPGIDYEIAGWEKYDEEWVPLDSAPADCGTYKMKLSGKGSFTGETSIYVVVSDDRDVASCAVDNVEQLMIIKDSLLVISPNVTNLNGKKLVAGRDYSYAIYDSEGGIVPDATIFAGDEYTLVITGIGNYSGQKEIPFYAMDDASREDINEYQIRIENIEDSYAYTGSAICPEPMLTVNGTPFFMKLGTEYVVSYSNNVTGPEATVTVAGIGFWTGAISKTFKIKGVPKKNPIKVKPKPIKVTQAKLKKKSVTVKAKKAFKVTNAKTKVTYKRGAIKCKKALAKQAKKKIKIAKNGKVTLKKGLKKGTYKVKVIVKAAGTKKYKAATRKVTSKIVVK